VLFAASATLCAVALFAASAWLVPLARLQKADYLYEGGYYSEAREIYRDLHETLDIHRRFRLALSYQREGKITDALREYSELLGLEKAVGDKRAKILANMGNLKADLGSAEDAVQHYRAALMNAEDENLRKSLETLLLRVISVAPTEETVSEALEIVGRRIESGEATAENYYRLARLVRFMGDVEYSIRFLEQALVVDHSFTAAYKVLGAIYFELKDHKRSISFFQRLLSYDPGSYLAHEWIGKNYEHIGDRRMAVISYRQAIAINGNSIGSRFGLARIFLSQRNAVAASAELYAIISGSPDEVYAEEARKMLRRIAPQVHIPPKLLEQRMRERASGN